MASWYVEERDRRAYLGRQRRQRACIVLALAWFSYMAVWGARNLLG